MKSLQEQFDQLKEQFSEVTLTPSEGVHLIKVPGLKLPLGWSHQTTDVRFVVPTGYPYAPPDCFWVDGNLRLQDGQMPQNAQMGNVVPGQSEQGLLWFSWHVQQAWNPGTCNLLTYLKVIRNRFEERK